MEEIKWFVYLIECKDNSYYTGITNNLDKRMKMHRNGRGSKYVYRKGFKKLLFFYERFNKSDACKEEYQIKQLSRLEKINWFKSRLTCN